MEIVSNSNSPIRITSNNSDGDGWIRFNKSTSRIGYVGMYGFNGPNDIELGTSGSNSTGNVHLTIASSPKLTVTRSGNVGIGTKAPSAKLEIEDNSSLNKAHLRLEEKGDDFARLELKNDQSSAFWHLAGYVGSTRAQDRFNIYNSAAGNIFSVHGNGNVYVDGALAHSSDRRLKKNIVTLPYGLEAIMQLAPKAYQWKKKDNGNGQMSFGLIAQEVQQIIKEVVHKENNKEEMLSISYTELVPVIIKAIQEQQEIIDYQTEQISNMVKHLTKLEASLAK